jgi:hypothetical protein
MGLFDFLQGDEKYVSAALMLIEQSLKRNAGSFEHNITIDYVMEGARQGLQVNKAQIANAVAQKKGKPESIAWRLVCTSASGCLSESRFYSGRGNLDNDGQEVRRIHDNALLELRRLGIIVSDEDLAALAEERDQMIQMCG